MAKNVVIVFTDFVGSTAVASRVGPERAEEMRSENFRLLRAALRPHLGREVKNLGDGLMIVFSNSSAAFSAGVAIQQAFHARNRFAADGERFDIRVGISSGDAYQEDGDFFGPPVVEASRLCGICDGGQILTSALVKSLVGTRGGFTFEGLGTRELKGLVEPVDVFAIGWEPLLDTMDPDLGVSFRRDSDRRVALPARLTPSPGAIFAGRVAERARWDDAWKDAAAGERRVWLLGGEAGIGKTSLVSRLAVSAHGDGGVVLYGRCDEDLGVPYQPWIKALSPLVAHAPANLIAAHVSARGGELARLVPGLAERADVSVPVASDAVAERYALFGAITDLLQRTAATGPSFWYSTTCTGPTSRRCS